VQKGARLVGGMLERVACIGIGPNKIRSRERRSYVIKECKVAKSHQSGLLDVFTSPCLMLGHINFQLTV